MLVPIATTFRAASPAGVLFQLVYSDNIAAGEDIFGMLPLMRPPTQLRLTSLLQLHLTSQVLSPRPFRAHLHQPSAYPSQLLLLLTHELLYLMKAASTSPRKELKLQGSCPFL